MRGILMLCTFAGALLFGLVTNGQTLTSVTLAWSPSPSSDAAGYYIYYGTSSGNYNTAVPAGVGTNATIRGLTSGQTYYFAAVSYDSQGNLGAFSPEIAVTAGSGSVTAVAGRLSSIAALPAGRVSFAVAGTTGAQYIVQASTDLVKWVTLQTNLAPFNFVDSNASQFGRRFYRTLYINN